MKLDDWGQLLVSWANFLDPNENIKRIEELCTSALFPRFLKEVQDFNETKNSEDYFSFLQEQFSSLDFSGSNREKAVLHATAFLIYCSLHHPNNNLQKKMIDLPHLTQCQFTNFLQEFVGVPRSMITRELIFSKISEMCSIGVLERSSVPTTPSFGTPVTFTSSPSTQEISASRTNSSSKKTSRWKKFRRDIDMLTSLKVELTEELDSAKECIVKLESDIKKKNSEICKLKSEIKKAEEVEHVCEKHKTNDNFKIEKLKATIENLEQQRSELEVNVMLLKNEKDRIFEELTNSKIIIQKAKVEIKLSEDIRSDLEIEMEKFKSEIEQLRIMNSEQSEYIAELTRAKDDSKSLSDSQSENVILPESLGQQVFDIQIRELQDEIVNKETEISELKRNIHDLYGIIEEKTGNIEELSTKLKSKDDDLEQKCCKLKCLENSVYELEMKLKTNEEDYQIFVKSSEHKINEIKDELDASLKNALFMKEKKEILEEKIICDMETIKSFEDEIKTLRASITEKDKDITSLNQVVHELQNKFDNTIKSNQEEIAIKTEHIKNLEESITEWAERNMELNNLLGNLTEELEENNLSIKNNEADLRNFESQNLYLSNTLQEKDSIINSMQTSINKLTCDLKSLKQKESSLVTELKASNCLILHLESKTSELNEVLSTCISEKNALLKTIDDKETTIQQQITKLKDIKTDFEARKRMLESDLEQKQKEHKEVEEDRCRLNIDLDNLKHRFVFLESQEKEKEKELLNKNSVIETMKTELAQSSEKETYLTNQIQEATKTTMQLEEELNASKSAISELQKEVSLLLSEAEQRTKDEFNLRNSIFINSEIINDLKIKLGEAELNCKHIQEEYLMEKKSMSSVIEELKLSLFKLNEDIVLNNDINDLLTKDLTERNEKIKNLENSIKTLQSKLLLSKEQNNILINDKSLKDIAIAELENDIKSYKAEIDTLVNEKLLISKKIETLKEDYNAQLARNENSEIQILEYVSKVNTLAKELLSKNSIIVDLESEIYKLKPLVIGNEEEREAAQEEINSLKEEIMELIDQKNALEEDLETTKNNLASGKSLLLSKSEIIKDHELKIDQLAEEKEYLEEAHSKLMNERDELQKILKNERKKIFYLKKECEGKTNQVNDYSQKLKDLLTQLDSDSKRQQEIYAMERTKLAEELNSLKNEYEKLKDVKEQLNLELESIKINHSCCEERNANQERLMGELKEKQSSLNHVVIKYKENEEAFKQDIDDKNNEIFNLNNEIDCLKKIVSTYEFEERILNTKLQAKETEIQNLGLSLGDLNKQLEATKEKLEEDIELKLVKIHDLDSTIGKLNGQYIQALKEKESLAIELENKKIIEHDFNLLQKDFQSLKEENSTFKRECVMKNEEISELKSAIQALKTENENKSKILQDRTKELEEINLKMKSFQDETIDCKTKEKAVMEQLVRDNNKIVSLEQIITQTDTKLKEAFSEIDLLKETVKKNNDQIESFGKERNCLKLDMDILSKKNEMFSSQLDSKKNEIQELINKLSRAECEIAKFTMKKTEQDQTIESLYSTLHSQNVEISEKNNEIEVMQKEYKNLIQQLSEERANKYTQIQKLKVDKEEQEEKLKSHISESEYKDRIDQLKCTYEKKVLSLKSIMKKQFSEKLEDLTYSIQNENTDLKEKLLKEQERCARLQSELWNASDKLLIAQEQNRTLLSNFQARNTYEVVRPSEPLSPISKARSMEVLSGRNRGIDNFARDISFNESGSSRRSSIRSLPRGMGKVFPAAEEDGEVFDNRYLADLKAGRCDVQQTEFDQNPSRISILQYRNSLCPPHLKSSYPGETQFMRTLKEDDIKASTSSLSGNQENEIRKTKVQSSYKKPGPPTPSKHGGKHSQDNDKPCPSSPRSGQSSYSLQKEQPEEKFILRESNNRREAAMKPPKPSTPSRLKALFTHKKEEVGSTVRANVGLVRISTHPSSLSHQGTPRRKSFFRRS